ncbi:hypothetical protein BDV40DRAFT_113233 [Aspergillus tamarii]|uniref:Uncharacterized protein n=1 Tax=Aspergillus tamarii TaxID=41984 RepID=A0A5N6UAL9_ASPTM|nr:hypothetical protein BDV40DRAFT_113233 [Aspergillus tamarii]
MRFPLPSIIMRIHGVSRSSNLSSPKTPLPTLPWITCPMRPAPETVVGITFDRPPPTKFRFTTNDGCAMGGHCPLDPDGHSGWADTSGISATGPPGWSDRQRWYVRDRVLHFAYRMNNAARESQQVSIGVMVLILYNSAAVSFIRTVLDRGHQCALLLPVILAFVDTRAVRITSL